MSVFFCKKRDAFYDEFAPTDLNKVTVIVSIILAAFDADGVISDTERKFAADVLGITVKNVNEFVDQYDSEKAELVDNIADSADVDTFAAVATLACAAAACDGKINPSEEAYIKNLFPKKS